MKWNLSAVSPKSRTLKYLVTVTGLESNSVTSLIKRSPPHTQMPGLQQMAKSQHPNLVTELATKSEQKSECQQVCHSISCSSFIIVFLISCDDICVLRMEKKAPQNRKVTDYYPIRRSNRKTKEELKVCMKGSNILILVFLNGCLFFS